MKTIIGVIVLVFVIVFCLQQIEKDRAIFYTSLKGTASISSEANVPTTYVSVKISGCVTKAGTYSVGSGSYLDDVITMAGGLTSEADTECFSYYLVIETDLDIYIPKVTTIDKVSINEGTIEDLKTLSGIGSTIATRIVEYREEIGEYTYLEQLKEVNGIGASLFNSIKNKIKL